MIRRRAAAARIMDYLGDGGALELCKQWPPDGLGLDQFMRGT